MREYGEERNIYLGGEIASLVKKFPGFVRSSF
jgi:hypothetical protein